MTTTCASRPPTVCDAPAMRVTSLRCRAKLLCACRVVHGIAAKRTTSRYTRSEEGKLSAAPFRSKGAQESRAARLFDAAMTRVRAPSYTLADTGGCIRMTSTPLEPGMTRPAARSSRGDASSARSPLLSVLDLSSVHLPSDSELAHGNCLIVHI
jgi:hypothetical protein